MTRSIILAAATAAAFGTAALAPTSALAKIETLGGCYDAVITWCNNTHPEHASECAGGGMDECDEEFGNASQSPSFDRLKMLVRPNGPDGKPTFKARLINKATFIPQAGEDRDDRRPTGGRGKSNR